MAREVGARDRLVRADQIENNTPIDIARGFARSDLKVRQIDSSHGAVCPGLDRFNSWRELISRAPGSSQQKILKSCKHLVNLVYGLDMIKIYRITRYLSVLLVTQLSFLT